MRVIPLVLTAAVLAPSLAAQAPDRATADAALHQKLEDTNVSFKFLETPLRACVQFLADGAGISIALAEDVYADTPITFSASGMPLRRALHWLGVLGGADVITRQGVVVLDLPENVARSLAELRLFDIRDLTLPIIDYPGEGMYPVYLGEDGGGAVFEVDEPIVLDTDTLIDLIVSTIEPQSWEVDGMSIQARRGVLFVANTPAVHEKVATLLADLRQKSIRLVTLEAMVYSVAAADWLASVGDDASADSPSILGAEEVATLHSAPGKLELRDQLQTSCASGQRVNVRVGGQSTHLIDIDVEVAQGSAIGDPVLGVYNTGIVLDVRPTPSADGKTIVLRVRLESSDLIEMQKIPYGPGDPGQGVSSPQLELPRTANFETHTSVRVDRGGACVFTFDDPSPRSGPGDRLVVVLQAALAAGENEEENR